MARRAPPEGSDPAERPAMGGGVARPERSAVGAAPALAEVEWLDECPSEEPSLEGALRGAELPAPLEEAPWVLEAVGRAPPVDAPAVRPVAPTGRAGAVPAAVPLLAEAADVVVICMFRSRSTNEPRAERGRSPLEAAESGRFVRTADMRLNRDFCGGGTAAVRMMR